jgi:hypothetical protein
VWFDNRPGFQDAGAFAALLTAVFGLISAALLLTAILVQSEELTLQRHELTLQREALLLQKEELSRLAVSSEHQISFGRSKSTWETKSQIAEFVRKYILSNENHLKSEMLTAAIETLWDSYKDSVDALVKYVSPVGLTSKSRASKGDPSNIRTLLYLRCRSLLYFKTKEREIFFHQLSSCLTNNIVLDPLIVAYRDAVEAGLETWLERQLPFSLGRFERISHNETLILLRIVCGHAKVSVRLDQASL